jgi:hypothetical protein
MASSFVGIDVKAAGFTAIKRKSMLTSTPFLMSGSGF